MIQCNVQSSWGTLPSCARRITAVCIRLSKQQCIALLQPVQRTQHQVTAGCGMQNQLIPPMQHIEDPTNHLYKQAAVDCAGRHNRTCLCKNKGCTFIQNIACTETKDVCTYIQNLSYTCQKHLDLSQPLAQTVVTSD